MRCHLTIYLSLKSKTKVKSPELLYCQCVCVHECAWDLKHTSEGRLPKLN